MIETSYNHAIEQLQESVGFPFEAAIVLHCRDWDTLIRMGIAEGAIDPINVPDPATLIPSIPIVLEEGAQYEGCVIVKRIHRRTT